MSKEIYVEPGDTLELPSGTYLCVLGDCSDCDIVGCCDKIVCSEDERPDEINVKFKKIEQ